MLICLVIRPAFRGRIISGQLPAAAVEHARPTDTGITYKGREGLFSGILASFESAGFTIMNRNRSLALAEQGRWPPS
ncbi:hypothetical protein EDF61_102264 [Arthrobacter sp. JUb115]|nr:hypothetical protein EDF61_102264 [Arthrobacter sp. JUb115]